MSNLERLKKAAAGALDMREEEIVDSLAAGSSERWDSLGHLNLMLAVEDEFKIKFDMEEIVRLISIGMIREAVNKRVPDA